MKYLIILFVFLFINSYPFAEVEYRGEVRLESRTFKNDKKNITDDNAFAGYARAEIKYTEESFISSVRAFGLIDTIDKDRNTTTIEDLYATYFFDEDETVSLTAGYKIFNWSATEAFHPADVINSQNLDSNLEAMDKLGELHIKSNFYTSIGSFSFYYFPKTEDPKFPGKHSRLGVGTNLKEPVWMPNKNERNKQNWHHQVAFRYLNSFDDADLSFHIIHHMNRRNYLVEQTPIYDPTFSSVIPIDMEYTPHFFKTLQIGGTYQHAIEGGWLIKAEGAYRNFYDNDIVISTIKDNRSPQDHSIVALGIEYVMSHLDGLESNVILEGQSLIGPNKYQRSELSVFQRDIMLGWRLAFNDVMGKELFLSIIKDIERKNETLFNINYTQRLSDNWKIKGGFRIYDAPIKESTAVGLEAYHNDHYVFINLSCYF